MCSPVINASVAPSRADLMYMFLGMAGIFILKSPGATPVSMNAPVASTGAGGTAGCGVDDDVFGASCTTILPVEVPDGTPSIMILPGMLTPGRVVSERL